MGQQAGSEMANAPGLGGDFSFYAFASIARAVSEIASSQLRDPSTGWEGGTFGPIGSLSKLSWQPSLPKGSRNYKVNVL